MNYEVVINVSYGGFCLSDKAIQYLADHGLDIEDHYPSQNELPRHHPLLVQCVKELDKEAGGQYSDLTIVKVNGLYRIHEYDGSESIETPKTMNWFDPTKY